jgi:hypothetical protein
MGVCKHYGPSIWNVAEKYREFAPEDMVEWVDDWLEADVCIDHTIGTPDRTNLVHPLEREFSEDVKARLEMAKAGAVKVAYVHHCAIVPDDFYLDTMNWGLVCTGFLDAPAILALSHLPNANDKWLRVAWGVDPAEFLLPMREGDPDYLIYTWGAAQDPETEYIKTIYDAVKMVGGKMLHSGLDYAFDSGDHYTYVPPAETKAEIARRYNSCWFANAMRDEDGFELANIEAPLSNAVAITLDRPCYRHFFSGGYGSACLFVKPGEHMAEQLIRIFEEKEYWHKDYISPIAKRAIVNNFNWRDAVTPFWERIAEKCS